MRAFVGVAGTLLGGAVAVALAGTVLAHATTAPHQLRAQVSGTASTPQGELPHAFLELDTWPDSMAGEHGPSGGSHPDWVSYGPASSLSVPAHSLVTVTIRQYDTGGELNNDFFGTVRGTVDGTATVDGRAVTQVDPTEVGHTFTIHAIPSSQDPLFVSVPLPAVADDAPVLDNGYPAPHVITFSFITGGPGSYVWQCEYPCGDGTYANFGGPMSAQGYMEGTLTVG
ncbi:MAG: hypothetical protein HY241_16485 [Actinobacteria bacterium]|nr:hypothetical protein [Actinomycetota bacterium]